MQLSRKYFPTPLDWKFLLIAIKFKFKLLLIIFLFFEFNKIISSPVKTKAKLIKDLKFKLKNKLDRTLNLKSKNSVIK